MPSMQVVLRIADEEQAFSDMLMPTIAKLVKRENGVTIEEALEAGLPEARSEVPASLTPGKMISVNGEVYVGNDTNVPIKLTYSHPTGEGYNHIPTGGTTGQYLTNNGSGSATWSDLPVADTSTAGITTLVNAVDSTDATKAATANAVKQAYDKANHDHPYVETSTVGEANGVVPLNANKLIDAQYLPSYVDDVLEGSINDELTEFTVTGEDAPCTPETGKIYTDLNTNKQYRWGGTKYVCLNEGVVLGETSDTAYRGDYGKIAYDHSQSAHAPADATKTEASAVNGNVKISGSEVTVYVHPDTAGSKHLPAGGTAGQYLKNVSDGTGEWTSADEVATEDSTNLITSGAVAEVKKTLEASIDTKADTTHTHSDASTTESGFMSASAVTKLAGIEDGANKTVVDTTIDQYSANPVENRVLYEALGNKSDTTHTHPPVSEDRNGFMTVAEHIKLANISEGANATVVDVALSDTSENPVQNKVIKAALDEKATVEQLNAKQDTITGAASTVVNTDLTASHVVIANASGKIAASPITTTELGYLDGVSSNIQTQLNAKAPIDSPTFTGTPSAPTAAAGTETTQVATTEFVQNAVNSLMDAKDALRFIGTLAPDDTLPAADAGHVYRVTGDGTISGLTVHENDTLTCCVDSTATNTPENWYVTHTNHDGMVMGPDSSVSDHVAVFDGATGKLVKDSGFTIGASVPADAVFTDTVYTHPSSGVTAAAYGQAADASVAFGETIVIPQVTVDAQGHVTAAVDRTITMPAAPTSISGNAGTATKLANARTIALSGDVTGSAVFDGSADVTIVATVASSGGFDAQYTSTQPTNQKENDMWYEPIAAVNS